MVSFWPHPTRRNAGAMELVIRIVHLIDTEDCFEAAFVKSFVVGYERQTFNDWLNLRPHFWEDRSILGVFCRLTLYLTAQVVVVFRLWLYQRIELISYLSTSYYNYANGTNGRTFVIGCFKVNCCEIFHLFFCFSDFF